MMETGELKTTVHFWTYISYQTGVVFFFVVVVFFNFIKRKNHTRPGMGCREGATIH